MNNVVSLNNDSFARVVNGLQGYKTPGKEILGIAEQMIGEVPFSFPVLKSKSSLPKLFKPKENMEKVVVFFENHRHMITPPQTKILLLLLPKIRKVGNAALTARFEVVINQVADNLNIRDREIAEKRAEVEKFREKTEAELRKMLETVGIANFDILERARLDADKITVQVTKEAQHIKANAELAAVQAQKQADEINQKSAKILADAKKKAAAIDAESRTVILEAHKEADRIHQEALEKSDQLMQRVIAKGMEEREKLLTEAYEEVSQIIEGAENYAKSRIGYITRERQFLLDQIEKQRKAFEAEMLNRKAELEDQIARRKETYLEEIAEMTRTYAHWQGLTEQLRDTAILLSKGVIKEVPFIILQDCPFFIAKTRSVMKTHDTLEDYLKPLPSLPPLLPDSMLESEFQRIVNGKTYIRHAFDLSDCSEETFNLFLDFLKKELNQVRMESLPTPSLVDLYYFSKQMLYPALTESCFQALKTQMNVEQIVTFLNTYLRGFEPTDKLRQEVYNFCAVQFMAWANKVGELKFDDIFYILVNDILMVPNDDWNLVFGLINGWLTNQGLLSLYQIRPLMNKEFVFTFGTRTMLELLPLDALTPQQSDRRDMACVEECLSGGPTRL